MFKSGRSTTIEENELLSIRSTSAVLQNGAEAPYSSSLGVPRSSRRIWASDYFLTLSCLACFALASTTVFQPATAIWLGQVNQLIALGFLLQLMAMCTQKHLQYFLLAAECLWNKSSLQNLDSIFQTSFLARDTSIILRLAIFLYLVLPLGMGVAYKGFTGGETVSTAISENGLFGWTGPPGTKGFGPNGIPLFFNTTWQWWNNPATSGVWGFNLHVESLDKSALLDGPTEAHVLQLQSLLGEHEVLELSATVNATVCDLVFDLQHVSETTDLSSWFMDSPKVAMDLEKLSANPVDAINEYSEKVWNGSYEADSRVYTYGQGLTFGMVIPPDNTGLVTNNSFIMTSRWNETNNETFGSVAQGFHIYRQWCNAKWLVSRSSITLSYARLDPDHILPTPTDVNPETGVAHIQYGIIENDIALLQGIFPPALVAFDWKWLGQYWSNDVNDQQLQQINIKSDATLVAAMVWARLTSHHGLTNPLYNITEEDSANGVLLYSTATTYQTKTPTLKRSILLAVVLAVNPVILLVTLLIRIVWLSGAPISKGFGFAALLAGIDRESLGIVKGAAYSGKLKADVRVVFSTSGDDDDQFMEGMSNVGGERRRKVTMRLEDPDPDHKARRIPNERVDSGVVYG